MEDEENFYALTEKGAEIVLRIDELFRTTDYDLNRIAFEVGLENIDEVRMVYALGVLSGLVDAALALEDENDES